MGALDDFYRASEHGAQLGAQLGQAQRGREQTALRNKLAPQLAEGDFAGASKTAFEGGDLQSGLAFQDQVRKMAKEDAADARAAGAETMTAYAELSKIAGRVDAMVSRGGIGEEQKAAVMQNELQRLKPLIDSNPQLQAVVPEFLRTFFNSPTGTFSVYDEEFSKQSLEETAPSKLSKERREEARIGFEERRTGVAEGGLDVARQNAETARLKAEKGGGSGSGKLTEGERKFATFGKLAENAQTEINRLEGIEGFNPTMVLRGAGNVIRNKQGQSYDAAKRAFIDAIIRPMTGAAVTKFEFDSAESRYFPKLGDDKGTVEFKRRLRQEAIDAIKAGSGGAFEQLMGGLVDSGSAQPQPGATPRIRLNPDGTISQ